MARRILLISGIVILTAFIVIQFFQPPRNYKETTTDDIAFHLNIPEIVKKPLINSCYDCHSNQTRYPWYSRIAPFSWMMNNHIVKGKEELNFSEWGQYNKRKQIGLLNEISEVINAGTMPLESYLMLHDDARLFKHEIEDITAWTEDAVEQVIEGD